MVNFNPPAPCGAGRRGGWLPRRSKHFNPPAPCGAGLSASDSSKATGEFQSTRPMRGGTRRRRATRAILCNFNPPAPCGAGRGFALTPNAEPHNFNPPAPCGAGPGQAGGALWDSEISIHPPHAGRDLIGSVLRKVLWISIHPPRAGRDGDGFDDQFKFVKFQSTRPVRGGTNMG